MKFGYIGVVVTLAASLAGCESAYVPPTAGDTAHMTFKKYKDYTTGVQTYEQAQTCTARHNIGLLNSDAQKSVAVPADAPLSITMSIDRSIIVLPTGFAIDGCTPTVTFTPKKGASYIAELATEKRMCSIKLTQVNADATTREVQGDEVQVRHWKRGFDASSSFCD